MKIRSPWWGFMILAGAIFIAVRSFDSPEADRENTGVAPSPARRSAPQPGASEEPLPATRSDGTRIESDWEELLQWLETDPKPSEEQIRKRLLATRSAWAEMDPHLLAETIGRLLETGRDTATGMKFRVGLHGFLNGWPTLRVFLLDALVAADPETAAAVAKRLLDGTKSPDEYAVALRSLTRDGSGSSGELPARFQYLLEKQEWQTSGGFAETLDLARTIGTRDAAARLLRWTGNPELKSMALHEFAADHPAEMLESLRLEAAVDPLVRANLMARLDPQNPEQLAALDEYLRDPARTAEDASVFLKSFPLRSATTGHRLYSDSPAPYQMDRIAAGDRAALALVDGWAADPALEAMRADLLALRKRLGEWVEQAK
ncbi:MAG: hypothetical protein V4689_21745 [Verrucomicrobiota bacterium]